MGYLQLKKRAFMSILNGVKGFVKTKAGSLPLALENCVDEESLISYSLHGNSVQDGTPSPDAPVEIESVGELNNLFNPNDFMNSSVAGITVIDECSFIATSKKESTTNTFVSLVRRVDYENLLGKKCEFYAEIEKSADYMVSGVVFQWVDSTGKLITPYPLDYSTSKFGKNVTFTMPDAPPDGAVYLNMVFMLARSCTIAIGDTVTFKNVSFYSIDDKYKIPVMARGKNLIPMPYSENDGRIRYGLTLNYGEDGIWYLNGTVRNTNGNEVDFTIANKLYLPPGNYTLSGCPSGGANRYYRILLQIQTTTPGKYRYSNDYGNGAQFYLLEGEYINVIYFRFAEELGTVENLIVKPMIEKGSEATEYEPYVEPVTTNIYLAEPLRAIDGYKDYIDFENGKVVRNIQQLTLKGGQDENWQIIESTATDLTIPVYYRNTDLFGNNKDCKIRLAKVFSNRFYHAGLSPVPAYDDRVNWISANRDSSPVYIAMRIRYNVAKENVIESEWKPQLQTWYEEGNPLIICYVMTNGIEKPITVPQLPTIKGTTVYEIDTTTQPSQMDATYYSTI